MRTNGWSVSEFRDQSRKHGVNGRSTIEQCAAIFCRDQMDEKRCRPRTTKQKGRRRKGKRGVVQHVVAV